MTDDSSANGTHKADPSHVAQKPEARSAVAWISGHDAVQMERASDQEFEQQMAEVMKSFPGLGLPRSFKASK